MKVGDHSCVSSVFFPQTFEPYMGIVWNFFKVWKCFWHFLCLTESSHHCHHNVIPLLLPTELVWMNGKLPNLVSVLKRSLLSVLIQPEQTGQNEKPVESFWKTIAEEDEQRLFTEKVNKTLAECLHLFNEVKSVCYIRVVFRSLSMTCICILQVISVSAL